MNIAGFSLSNWITYGFSFVGGPVAWRVPLAFQFLFIAILYATVPWLPESPRWLIAKGRIEEADQILADLEGTTPDDPYVVTESKEIQYAVTYERDNAPAWKDLLRGKTGPEAGTCTMRRLFLGMGTQAMQQLSGINVSLIIRSWKVKSLRLMLTFDVIGHQLLSSDRPYRFCRPHQQSCTLTSCLQLCKLLGL